MVRIEFSKLLLLLTFALFARQTNSLTCPAPPKTSKLRCGVPKTGAEDWPWHAAIFHRENQINVQVCSGTLVSEQFILTAAHCVTDLRSGQQLLAESISVGLGVQSSQQHSVANIEHFEGFIVETNWRNDIVLLELSSAVNFTDHMLPACIDQRRYVEGDVGTLLSWSDTEDGTPLRNVQLPIVEDLECLASNRDAFRYTLGGGTLCAGRSNGSEICEADVGSGLFVQRGDAWYLVGLLAYTETIAQRANCVGETFDVFTRTFKYLPWLRNVTGLEESSAEVNSIGDYSTLFPSNCGFHNSMNEIFRDEIAGVFEFPWMAYILNEEYNCFGVLINNRYLLAPSGCPAKDHSLTRVLLGEHTLDKDEDCNVDDPTECAPPVQEYGIECIVVHPDANFTGLQHDIALVRLDRDVEFEDHIQPICLPVTPKLRQLEPSQFIGYGWRAGVGELRKSTMSLTNGFFCNKVYARYSSGNFSLSDHFCAGREPTDSTSCLDNVGYVGSIAEYGGHSRFVQFGITAWSIAVDPCALSYPLLFTNISAYMDWIVENIQP